MKNKIQLIIVITLITLGCSQEKETTIKNELLKSWSISDSTNVNLFDFATISQFDDYQYQNQYLFDSIQVILPIEGHGIELIPEGNKLKNDLLCIIPLPEERIIRFQFSESGDELIYDDKRIEPEESKNILITRLKRAEKPNHQIISLVFEDSINQKFVHQSIKWINDGYVTFVTGGLSPDSTINEFNDLDQTVKENLDKYRLIYGIGRAVDKNF
ncbi:MAG: hypothetical protein KDD15_07080 [Lewinella sp.]|nr:hypothetical protein [Lewinella sp.]